MPSFDGFQETDFSDQVGGVYWRSREALGGVLAQALRNSFQSHFESWSVRRRTELHIGLESHYDYDNPFPYAKLFVYTPRTPRAELAFGFYVEKQDKPMDGRWHWTRFVTNLEEDPVMRTAMLAAMRNHALIMTDYYRQDTGGALGCRFLYHQGQFCRQRPGEAPQPVGVEDLIRRLKGVNQNKWCDLHLFTTMPKADAVALKERVVNKILTVFHSLVPVYEGAIRR
jgi:hypothetical protein